MPSTLKKTADFLVKQKKADFLFTVKGNQPGIRDYIASLHLDQTPPQFRTIDKAHGRLETRSIWTSTRLVEYIGIPHVRQCFTIRREVFHIKSRKITSETAYGITSLSPKKGSPERLLTANRGHWSIENRLHYIRDFTFDEDRSQIRTGHGPFVMATIRNFTIGLLKMAGASNIAAATRDLAAKPWRAIKLIGL